MVEQNSKVRLAGDQDKRSIGDLTTLFPNKKGQQGLVQLVRPFAVLSATTYSAAITLPMGIAYLASVLEKSGYPVKINDAIEMDLQRIERSPCGTYNLQGATAEKIIDAVDPDAALIGISLMFSQEWLPHRDLIKGIRKKAPRAVIVVGGEHATAMPEYILRDCPEIDYLVAGEGEYSFLELVHEVVHSRPFNVLKGVSWINEDNIFVDGGLSARIAQLDDVPRPAWHLFDVEPYFSGSWTMGISMGRNMPILATRGCPYQCTFCSNPTMWTTRYLMRDVKEVVDEIEWLKNEYQADSIEFYDLTAIIKKEWIMAFCAELKSRKIDITWQLPSGTRSEVLDQDVLSAIYDTGCMLLVYAPESGSDVSLKKIKKKLKLERLNNSVRTAVKVGHNVKINLIIGFPHETLKDVIKTVWYGAKMAALGVRDCNFATFTPYPGSELYREMLLTGEVPEPNDDYFKMLLVQFDLTKPISYCPNVSGYVLSSARVIGLALFYGLSYLFYPKRLVDLLRVFSKKPFQAESVFEQRVFDIITRLKMAKSK